MTFKNIKLVLIILLVLGSTSLIYGSNQPAKLFGDFIIENILNKSSIFNQLLKPKVIHQSMENLLLTNLFKAMKLGPIDRKDTFLDFRNSILKDELGNPIGSTQTQPANSSLRLLEKLRNTQGTVVEFCDRLSKRHKHNINHTKIERDTSFLRAYHSNNLCIQWEQANTDFTNGNYYSCLLMLINLMQSKPYSPSILNLAYCTLAAIGDKNSAVEARILAVSYTWLKKAMLYQIELVNGNDYEYVRLLIKYRSLFPFDAQSLRWLWALLSNNTIMQDHFQNSLAHLDHELIQRYSLDFNSIISFLRSNEISWLDTVASSSNLPINMIVPRSQIIDKDFFLIGFNYYTKIPLWTSYRLSKECICSEYSRISTFRRDPEVPSEYCAVSSDYKGSDYDKGHLIPACDFCWNDNAKTMTFLYTNISPQTPSLNRVVLRQLESQIRKMLRNSEVEDIWVITGNLFMTCDSIATIPINWIGDNNIAIPTHIFKVIITKLEGGRFRKIAYLLPNQFGPLGSVNEYQIKLNRLEEIIGYEFSAVRLRQKEAYMQSEDMFNYFQYLDRY
ncbi:MAG: DNA/RNA non-specific endonuclease [candidate division Zixibacteria bacterium]|nr:DNA/RNA non-specific endonuclease [candidate division Zixibacteria bacterium]